MSLPLSKSQPPPYYSSPHAHPISTPSVLPVSPIPPHASSSRPSPAGTFTWTLHHVPHLDEVICPRKGQHIQGYYVVF